MLYLKRSASFSFFFFLKEKRLPFIPQSLFKGGEGGRERGDRGEKRKEELFLLRKIKKFKKFLNNDNYY